jgi:N-acetylmuramoyl-L-alanine amidase
LYEKDLVLDISQRLATLIQDRPGSEVLLTRSDDTFVPLEGRTKIANDYKADLPSGFTPIRRR